MRTQSIKSLSQFIFAVALSVCVLPAFAQFGGGGGGGGFGGGGGGGFGGGGGGGLGGGAGGGNGGSGVIVDADGVLSRVAAEDPNGDVSRQRIAEAHNRLQGDLASSSKLRKVSLTKLEAAIAKRVAAGMSPTDAMKNLAGLTQIEYVFCYPETGEIVIAGAAEPWAVAPSGRTLGIESGKPIIELQDLVAALRAFPPTEQGNGPVIYCSIDPTAEGLARMQQFLTQFGRQARPSDTQFIVEQLQDRLGKQVVTVGGVPAETHFAQVIVEADYRMKLIGIGLETPAVKLRSYVDRANPAMVGRNALQRWFFVPDYERLMISEDGLAAQIVGDGVKLIGEDEMVSSDGTRKQVGATNRASQAFVTSFTKSYSKLAEVSPVYAQLRNCIDLAVTAALIRQNDFYGQTGWKAEVLNDEEQLPIKTFNAPKHVATAVNSIWKGSTLMTPIGGGVQINPSKSLEPVNVKSDESGALRSIRDTAVEAADADAWWWD